MNLLALKTKLMASDIGSRVAGGIFWSFTGTAMAKLIVLVAGIACARLMGKEEFGEFGMVRSTINMFAVVGTAGFGLTAAKYIAEYRHNARQRIPSIYLLTNIVALVVGVLLSLVIFVMSPALADALNSPTSVDGIRIGTLLLFVTILNTVQNGTLQGFERFKAISINTFIGSLSESVLMLLGAYYWGVTGAILGFGMGFVAIYLANVVSIRRVLRQYGITIHVGMLDKSDFSLLYKFSLPAILTSFTYAILYWLIKTMLVRYDGFAELAIFEAADQWKVIILFVPTAIGQVVLPILSSIGNNSGRFWKVLYVNMAINGGAALLLALGVLLLGNNIMSLYGQGYDNVYPLILLCFTTVFMATANVVGLSITSRAKMWTGFGFNMLWSVLLLTMAYVFLERGMGATGIALAMLLAYIVHTVLQMIYLRRIV